MVPDFLRRNTVYSESCEARSDLAVMPEAMSQPSSLKALFAQASRRSQALDALGPASTATYQENLVSAISSFEACQKLASEISLFSPNESLEDISSGDLQYLLIDFHIAHLSERSTSGARKAVLLAAKRHYENFLKLLDSYEVLTRSDGKLYEQYKDDPASFSTASTSDPAARRNTKIARYKEEQELKRKLAHLREDPQALESDDDALRDLRFSEIALHVYETFQALESMAMELQILSMAPPPPAPSSSSSIMNQTLGGLDPRQRYAEQATYSERLDAPSILAAGNKGPLLDKKGKPLRPFTILGKRDELRNGVFRPDHSLPTMSIDEYLEEEKRRGGIIEGGGEASGIRPDVDEDDLDKADEETMKQRAWDEFAENNPKGSGNTLNRG